MVVSSPRKYIVVIPLGGGASVELYCASNSERLPRCALPQTRVVAAARKRTRRPKPPSRQLALPLDTPSQLAPEDIDFYDPKP